jgi:quinol monooxygenase YgiN
MNRLWVLVGLVALTIAVRGQGAPATAGDATRYAVAYVEVEPSAVASTRAAFDAYRSASRGELGFIDLELFQQLGKPGQLVIVETWRDQATIEGHAKAASTTRFRAALAPIRVSGYDERPYKAFAVKAMTEPNSRDPVYVVTHVDVGPPGDATALMRQLADESRAEPGCLRFDVLQHAARANHFTIIEAWRDLQARDNHAAAAHTRQYREALQPMIGSPLDERLMGRP